MTSAAINNMKELYLKIALPFSFNHRFLDRINIHHANLSALYQLFAVNLSIKRAADLYPDFSWGPIVPLKVLVLVFFDNPGNEVRIFCRKQRQPQQPQQQQ